MTEHMSLEWRHCQTGNWMAPLPAIPGYPYGGPFHFFSHLVTLVHPGWDTKNVTDKWTCDISLHLQTGGTAVLRNEDLNIPGTATVEEMKQMVENLTVEDIAAAFTKKGYQPERTGSLKWERDEYGSYIAQLPLPVPGYPGIWYATVDHFTGISQNGDWHLTISNRPNPTVFLYKDIPGIVFHAKTAEELMSIVEEQLTPEMIADALQAKGYEPVGN